MVRFAKYIKYVSTKSDNQENGIVDSLSVEDFTLKPKEKNKPKLILEPRGERSLLSADSAIRAPLTFSCIQCLILQALLGKKAPQPPSWCNLLNRKFLSNVTVVVVDGWDLLDLTSIISDWDESPWKRRKVQEETSNLEVDSNLNESVVEDSDLIESVKESLPFSSTCFPLRFEVASPSDEPIVELFSSIPMSRNVVKALKDKYRSLRRAASFYAVHVVLPVACEDVPELKEKFTLMVEDHKDQFNRVDLLMSAREMAKLNYPLGLEGTLSEKFVPLHSHYEKVTENSPMFGIDCEMCKTCVGSELTRISVVDEKLNVIYSTFVKPSNRIVDFLTRYSGVTPENLMNVTTSVGQVQQKLREIMPRDCILVGHSLDNDLNALQLLHPYVIDTSLIYNLSQNMYSRPSLKLLTKVFLNKEIQTGDIKGHDPTEDAAASLGLVLLKLRNNISFGDLSKGGELPCSKIRFLRSVRKGSEDKLNSFDSVKFAFGESYGSNVPKIIRLEVDNKSTVFTNNKETVDHFKSYGVESCHMTQQFTQALEAEPESHTNFKLIIRHCQVPDILSSGKSQKKLRKKLKLIDEKLSKLHETLPENSLIMTLFTKKLDSPVADESQSVGLLLLDFKGQDVHSFHRS